MAFLGLLKILDPGSRVSWIVRTSSQTMNHARFLPTLNQRCLSSAPKLTDVINKEMKNQPGCRKVSLVSACSNFHTGSTLYGYSPNANVKKESLYSDHRIAWVVERIISISLLGIVPYAFLLPSEIADSLLAIVSVLHAHWGLESVIVDYLRPAVVGNITAKLGILLTYTVSALLLVGLGELIYNGPGLVSTIVRLWHAV